MRGLGWSSEEERPVDRVTAAGMSAVTCPLGLLLWKCRDGLEAAAYHALKKELFRRYTKRYRDDPAIAQAVVDQAVREHLGAQCRECHGKREIVYQDRRMACSTCQGSGTHRYSDTERASTMHLSYARVKHSSHKIGWIIELLASEDKRFSLLMSQQLDR